MVRPHLSLIFVASRGQGLKTNLRQTWARARQGVGKKIAPVCAGNSKPFILVFLFHSMNTTIKSFAWEFLPNRRMKSLKLNKVGKSHLLFCFQQRCLLASTDQKTKRHARHNNSLSKPEPKDLEKSRTWLPGKIRAWAADNILQWKRFRGDKASYTRHSVPRLEWSL